MSILGYSITATNWRTAWNADRRLGQVDLTIDPLGLKLYGIKIITTDAGLRAVFPGRVLMSGPELRRLPDGKPAVDRFAGFPDHGNWIAFSAAAIEAIEAAFPGILPQTESVAA